MSGGPYVNDSGDIWIERGAMPWPKVLLEARWMADEILDYYPSGVLRYDGIEEGVRVSDEYEQPHMDEESCKEGCCRTITAYHFRAVEP
jgi:hypothetical protein